MGQTKPQDGCVQSLLLQYIKQRIFACVVLAPSGEVEREYMINTYFVSFCCCVSVCICDIIFIIDFAEDTTKNCLTTSSN